MFLVEMERAIEPVGWNSWDSLWVSYSEVFLEWKGLFTGFERFLNRSGWTLEQIHKMAFLEHVLGLQLHTLYSDSSSF